MAYFKPTSFDDEEDKLKREGGTKAPTFAAAAPQETVGAQGNAQTTKVPKGSGFFTNLNSFIDANKGKSEKFAGGVVDNTSAGFGKAVDTASGEVEADKKGIGSKEFTFDADEGNKFINDIGGMDGSEPTYGKVKNILGGDTGIDKDGFTFTDGNVAIDNAIKTADELNTEGGKGNVTKNFYKDNSIATRAGERNFDSLLVNRDEAAKGKFTDLRNNALDATSGLGAKRDALKDDAGKFREGAIGRSAEATKAWRNNLTGAQTGTVGAIDKAVADKNAERERAYRAAAGERQIGFNTLNPETPWVTAGRSATRSDVATPEQIAKLRALSGLMGKGDVVDPSTSDLGSAYTVDEQGYAAAIQAEKDRAAAQKKAEEEIKEKARQAAMGISADNPTGVNMNPHGGVALPVSTAPIPDWAEVDISGTSGPVDPYTGQPVTPQQTPTPQVNTTQQSNNTVANILKTPPSIKTIAKKVKVPKKLRR